MGEGALERASLWHALVRHLDEADLRDLKTKVQSSKLMKKSIFSALRIVAVLALLGVGVMSGQASSPVTHTTGTAWTYAVDFWWFWNGDPGNSWGTGVVVEFEGAPGDSCGRTLTELGT